MSDAAQDKRLTDTVKTCRMCSHMRLSNKGKTAECAMKGKGMHAGIKFHRQPNGEFDTFAWLKARDCSHYDGDEEEMTEEEPAEAGN